MQRAVRTGDKVGAQEFQVIRSDVVRKELGGLPADAPTPEPLRAKLYAHEYVPRTPRAQTYARITLRAECCLAGNGLGQMRRCAALLPHHGGWGPGRLVIACLAAADLQARAGKLYT